MPRYYIKLWKKQDLEQYEKLYNSIRDKQITPEQGGKILKELWNKSTEKKLVDLTKKMKAEKKKRMEEEGVITDYTTLSKEELKETKLWQAEAEEVKKLHAEAEEKPYDRKKTQKIKEIHKKGIDKYITERVYYYQKVHQETYEVEAPKKISRPHKKNASREEKTHGRRRGNHRLHRAKQRGTQKNTTMASRSGENQKNASGSRRKTIRQKKNTKNQRNSKKRIS